KTLDDWITDSQHVVPGNQMTFAGIKDARQRVDLLAFLKEATQPGSSVAQQGAPMGGGMMGGMMGGGQVPNLNNLIQRNACKKLLTARTRTRSRPRTARPENFGSAICA